jgi:TRAP-type transport system small permease protein
MSVQANKNLLSKINESLVRVLNFFAIWALAGMMFLTFIDVLLRYIFNNPIQGKEELIAFLMAIVIPFSIVFCAQQVAHVRVDFILEGFPKIVQKILHVFSNLLMLVLFIPITWQSFIFVMDEMESKLTSPVLYIPVYPFIAVVAVAFLVLTLVLIERLMRSLSEIVS